MEAVMVPSPPDRRVPFSPKRLLPEPPRHRRVSKSAPPARDPLGLLLEEWLSELRIGYTHDAD
ncbi:MAG: hypothetical protein ACR2G8_05000 [Candidatus Limnocylindria bacterium]